MPQPIRCLDEEACHFAERFRSLFSKPHYQYFVTVLLGLMECEGRRTSCWIAGTAPNACGTLPASGTFSSPLGSRAIAGCVLPMKRLPKAGAGTSFRTMRLS